MKLELKHLASYLPYELMFKLNLKDVQDNYKNEARFFTMECGNVDLCLMHKGKPILRHLSDLTKEIDGVVHLVELANIFKPDLDWTLVGNIAKSKLDLFEFGFTKDYLFCMYDLESFPINKHLVLYDYLFQHHFDVYGLIDKGLAIDINTIENV